MGVGDWEIEIVTVLGEADLFEGVDVDGGKHWGPVLCFKIRYGLGVARYAEIILGLFSNFTFRNSIWAYAL